MLKIQRDDLIVESFPIGSFACNCSLVYSESTKEAIIIDPGNDLPTLMDHINRRSLKVKKLLHTHAHFDHIGQSAACKRQTGAKLYLHGDDLFLYEALQQQGMLFNQPVGEVAPVDTQLEPRMSFSLEESGLRDFLETLHTPGHTPGSCCFYSEFFEEPVLFAGDTLFHGSIGRTDLPGGDMQAILKSIKGSLFTLPGETQVITGHGESTRVDVERRHNPFCA